MIKMLLAEITEKVKLEPEESVAGLFDSMDQISLQVSRCSTITQSILKFGRQGQPKPQYIQLKDFMPQVVDMLKKKASVNGIQIKEDFGEQPVSVYGDPSELQQVLVNLINNAMDAVEEDKSHPDKQIRVKVIQLDDHTVQISVADTGVGISPENLDKVFTPFFTSKPVGKGTGLGLSVCYGIIDKMGGKMDVASTLDEGTTFTIQLPVADEKQQDNKSKVFNEYSKIF